MVGDKFRKRKHVVRWIGKVRKSTDEHALLVISVDKRKFLTRLFVWLRVVFGNHLKDVSLTFMCILRGLVTNSWAAALSWTSIPSSCTKLHAPFSSPNRSTNRPIWAPRSACCRKLAIRDEYSLAWYPPLRFAIAAGMARSRHSDIAFLLVWVIQIKTPCQRSPFSYCNWLVCFYEKIEKLGNFLGVLSKRSSFQGNPLPSIYTLTWCVIR